MTEIRNREPEPIKQRILKQFLTTKIKNECLEDTDSDQEMQNIEVDNKHFSVSENIFNDTFSDYEECVEKNVTKSIVKQEAIESVEGEEFGDPSEANLLEININSEQPSNIKVINPILPGGKLVLKVRTKSESPERNISPERDKVVIASKSSTTFAPKRKRDHSKEVTDSVTHRNVTKDSDRRDSTIGNVTVNEKILASKQFSTKPGKVTFKCTKCSFKTHEMEDAESHMLIHGSEKLFVCPTCGFKTKMFHYFSVHTCFPDYPQETVCSLCNYRCKDSFALKNHMNIHTGEKPNSCLLCEYKCDTMSQLKTHMAFFHSGEKPFACTQCDFKCRTNLTLKNHMLTHISEKPFACNQCDIRFNSTMLLNTHMLEHAGEKPLECSECDFKCVNSATLKRHMITHTGGKPFACKKCEYKTNKSAHLKAHMLSHAINKNFSCSECDFTCQHANTFKKHVLTHTTVTSFKEIQAAKASVLLNCTECDFKCLANKKGDLDEHMKRHIEFEKSFVCNICKDKFRVFSSLKSHMRLCHSEAINDKSEFMCSECNFRSKEKSLYDAHILTHETGYEDFKYKCSKCGFKCKQKRTINLHMIAHLGKVPFTCEECGIQCQSSAAIKSHMITHQQNVSENTKPSKQQLEIDKKALTKIKLISFTCSICEYKCKSLQTLKVHMSNHK
ncbi:unnamed protein product [Meganyctiphanes norvegica]|uniref:C2H2-type domain-containing protein n=1 Tax=Meganyctiphanes norvegica TaxID=48144 RepID=A0AAV2S556_MEGNR